MSSTTQHDASRRGPAIGQKPSASPGREGQFNYLLLSDVHLGSDIIPHMRPWAKESWLLHEAEVDAHLVGLLEHYRRERDPERPWCLILAGDFVDLVGVSISPESPLRTEPTRDERVYGLGSASDHVVQKMRAIADRHVSVFRALADFVADGHRLVVVRGNHDVELHWHAAQRAFVKSITQHAPREQREGMRSRIEICPWFFVVDGLLYVEHGHEFDAMCSYGDPLMPTCMRDPRRINATPFSVLLRQVARPTRGLRAAGYQYVGMGEYLRLLVHLGVRGSVRIAGHFARASYLLLRECYTSLVVRKPRRERNARARHELFAARKGVCSSTLERLRQLYVAPATKSFGAVLRSLYLDRVLTSILALAVGGCGILVAERADLLPVGSCLLLSLLLLMYTLLGGGKNTSPTERMRRSAAKIAALFGTRYVVMGHTHEPVFDEVAPDVRYVNLGSWGEDDPPEERGAHDVPSPCSFMQLRYQHGDYQCQFLRWDSRRGPVPFHVPTPLSASEQPGFAPAGPYSAAQG
ncbi:MAG: metallophosphoesterase [Myxococcales bacterium]